MNTVSLIEFFDENNILSDKVTKELKAMGVKIKAESLIRCLELLVWNLYLQWAEKGMHLIYSQTYNISPKNICNIFVTQFIVVNFCMLLMAQIIMFLREKGLL